MHGATIRMVIYNLEMMSVVFFLSFITHTFVVTTLFYLSVFRQIFLLNT